MYENVEGITICMKNNWGILINIIKCIFDQFINPSINNDYPKCIYLSCYNLLYFSTSENILIS
jgi:hypothetical protein